MWGALALCSGSSTRSGGFSISMGAPLARGLCCTVCGFQVRPLALRPLALPCRDVLLGVCNSADVRVQRWYVTWNLTRQASPRSGLWAR